jgi:PadR family transcriptional regulator PadR
MQDRLHEQVDAWRSQLRKGSLELAVLVALQHQQRYGLELVDLLNQLGLGISEGSIYPLLSRLKADKKVETEWVEAESGHAHKYYRLTAHGRAVCRSMVAAWREFNAAFAKLLEDHG